MNEIKITCTPLAIEKMKEKLATKNMLGIRLGIRSGGCNGFQIVFELAEKTNNNDHIFLFDGVKLFIDAKSSLYLDGTNIDYTSNLLKHGFMFSIPKQTSSCGCKVSIGF